VDKPMIEAGHKYIRSLLLTPEQQFVLRANLVEHRTYKFDVRSSVFNDIAPVCEVLRMPARPVREEQEC
jgi:hypothetical protein